jgi:HEAT repeat protein
VGRAVSDLRRRSLLLARERLARLGDEGLPPGERQARVSALLARLPRRVVERVAADGSSPAWLADAFAAHVLERWGAERLVRDASRHRGENSRWRRIARLRILCRAGHGERLRLLEAALRSGDHDVAGTAVALLGELRERPAAELLVAALRERLHPHSRVAARLDAFPLDIPELILPLTASGDAGVRFWGAVLLARYAGAPGTEDALVALGRDGDPMVRKAAVDALALVPGQRATAVALRLLGDDVGFVRAHAARALGERKQVELARHVLALLADPEWFVRAAAKDALLAMGPCVARDVIACLDHPDRFARNGAAELLQNLGRLGEAARRVAANEGGEDEVVLLRAAAAAGGDRLARTVVERAGAGDDSRQRRLQAALDGPREAGG